MNIIQQHGTSELEAALYGGSVETRLDALRQLCAELGERPRRGTNCHIHTNESFSVFRSPAEAVWQAAREGLAVLGINDHYTVAGHEEFRQACKIAGVRAGFSMEAVAMDRAAEAGRLLLNDPDNPGRVYLCAKGITRIPPDSSSAATSLARMRAALEGRNREMTVKVAQLFRERLNAEGPAWEDVRALTPRGNTTERHVGWAALVRLREIARGRGETVTEVIERCCAAAPPPGADDAALQIFLRAKLLKAGAPCYVRETDEAFVSSEELREMFLAFGAIPTYPVLGNPVTSGERDVEALLDRLEGSGFLCDRSHTAPEYAGAAGGDCLGGAPPLVAGIQWHGTQHTRGSPTARPVRARSGVRAMVPAKHRADARPPVVDGPRGTWVCGSRMAARRSRTHEPGSSISATY